MEKIISDFYPLLLLVTPVFCFSFRYDRLLETCSIALVGKYTKFSDSYASVIKALEHSALAINHKLDIKVCVFPLPNPRAVPPLFMRCLINRVGGLVLPLSLEAVLDYSIQTSAVGHRTAKSVGSSQQLCLMVGKGCWCPRMEPCMALWSCVAAFQASERAGWLLQLENLQFSHA